MAPRPLLAAAFAAFLLLAGCITPNGSRDAPSSALDLPTAPASIASLKEILPLEFTMDDGVRIRGHIYLPDSAPPYATVLVLSPYWNNLKGPSEDQARFLDGRRTMTDLYTEFIDGGFAVALVNVRGTGISDGCFQWGGKLERHDAYAVIEDLADKPWSNGAVGMYGKSYEGFSQEIAVAAAPPSLKAIIPTSSMLDYWSVFMRNGAPLVFYGTSPAAIPLWIAGTSLGAFGATQMPKSTGPSHFPCPRYQEDTTAAAVLATTGDRSAYTDERDYRPFVDRSTVPMFVNEGIGQYPALPQYGGGNILQIEGLWDIMPPDRRLMLGQWAHEYPHITARDGIARTDFMSMAVAWFDHYLRGGPATTPPGVVDYQDDAGNWHVSDRWPPASTPSTVYLSGREIVAAPEAVRAGSQVFQTGTWRDPGVDQCGRDQALFVSEPLKDELFLAGNFFVNLTMTSSLPGGNLAVFLYHIQGDGACPDTSAKEIRRVYATLRHVHTDYGKPFPTNLPTSFTLKSQAFAATVPAGARFVLAVGGQGLEIVPNPHLPMLSVETGSAHSGWVTLPVVSGEFAFQG